MWIPALGLACRAPAGDPPPPGPAPVGPPALEAEVAAIGPGAPLSFALTARADRPVAVVARWEDEHGPTEVAWPAAAEHDVVLTGFHPDRAVPVEVEAIDAGGRTATVELDVTTPPLPAAFAERTVLAHDPARAAPGLTVLPARADADSAHAETDYVLALDAYGHVVWVYASPRFVYDARLLPSGRFLLAELGRVVEIDRAGREVAAWEPEGWGVGGIEVPGHPREFHHEAAPASGGGLLTLTWRPRRVEAFPVSYDDPAATAPVEIADDVALAFDRDGTVRWTWAMGDLLDVHRLGYDSLRRRNTPEVGDREPADWGHANAVVETDDGSVVVSLRHQDAVVRFDPLTGAIRWILANHDNWPPELQPYLLAPVGELAWPYHQHAPELGPDGQLLLFDNGNERASPWTGQARLPEARSWSRAVAFAVDEAAGTVRQTFGFGDAGGAGGEVIFSGQLGDADWLENGNVLVTYGHVTHVDGARLPSVGLPEHAVRLIEVEPASGDVVWDLLLTPDPAVDPVGWTANRAQRVPTLFPEL